MLAWLEREVHAISLFDYQVLFLLLVIAIPILAYYSRMGFRRFRFIDATATSRVRSAVQGYVELKGLGEWLSDGEILSPFSNSRCVWYRCTVEKRRWSGKRVTWINVFDETSNELFRLVDETGHCLVNPDQAQVVPECSLTRYGDSQNDYHRLFKSSPSTRFVFSGRYRFREQLIRTATQIYALGWFSSFYTDMGGDIDREAKDLVRQWKLQPLRYLHQFDLDGDQKIRKSEWSAVYQKAKQQVMEQALSQNRLQHLLSKPDNSKLPYMISALPEQSLTNRNKWMAYGMALAAFVTVVMLFLLYSIRSPLPA